MRKLSFYPKLAFGNLWRNKSTYVPYLLACVVSIFTFYVLQAIHASDTLDGMRGESVVKSFTAVGTVIMAIFCSILIFYTNSFLAKRRKKELGLYSILGMEKRNIAVLMFFETLFVACIALALGLALGMLLSQLLFWVLLRMVRYPVMLEMPVSLPAVYITTVFFGCVFLLTLLANLRQVRLANPVDLMAGARQGEREPKTSWPLAILGVLCLSGGYFVALYYQNPVEALMFFLLAVFLVIVGTYCLFTAGSIALLKLLRKNKRYYYKPNHFIAVSGMIYRMRQNAAGLATICILSCMVLVTVSATVSLNVGAEDSLRTQYPYEYEAEFTAPEGGDALLAGAERIAADTGVQLVHLQDYQRASLTARDLGSIFGSTETFTGPAQMAVFNFVTLEAYNRNEGLQATLAPGEALMLVTGGSYTADTLTLDGITYHVTQIETLGNLQAGTPDLGRTMVMVLPDAAAVQAALDARPPEVQEASPGGLKRGISFDVEGEPAAKEQFLTGMLALKEELRAGPGFDYFRSRDDAREGWYASNGGFLFLGVYFGILFMLAAALIIYYKQLSEGYDDAARFEILQKVGMSEGEVKKAINGQILTVFFLPLAVAVVHIAVAFFPISRAMVLFSVINIPLLAAASVCTILAYTAVYLLVFRRTAKSYFRIVQRQTASK